VIAPELTIAEVVQGENELDESMVQVFKRDGATGHPPPLTPSS
jgi:hypothetical protein